MSKKYRSELTNFWTINLSNLNNRASYLKRKEKKYLLNSNEVFSVIKDLKKDFKILEIKWQKIFSYDNIYMDSSDYLFYNDHQNKKNSRTKIRTRYYLDSNTAFFEYKHKLDWILNKYRYEFPSKEHWFMTKWKKRFFEWVWQSIYNWKEAPKITPSINTIYKRITMVSKDFSERLTIDFDINIINLRDKKAKKINLKNLVIIESKSLKKETKSSEIMKKFNIELMKSCSKYSIWVIYSGIAKKYDTFEKTCKKIKKIRLEIINNKKRKFNSIQNNKFEKTINNRFEKKSIKVKTLDTI